MDKYTKIEIVKIMREISDEILKEKDNFPSLEFYWTDYEHRLINKLNK